MTMKAFARNVIVCLLSAGLLWAGDPWKEKPYTEWTEKEVLKVLGDSPWAKVQRSDVYRSWERRPAGLHPGDPWGDTSGSRRPSMTEFRVTVRWLSSLTIQQALEREAQLNGTVSEKPEELRSTDYYLIFVLPELASVYTQAGQPQLSVRTLQSTSQPEAFLQPQLSKQKIAPDRVVTLGHGLVFMFPREQNGNPSIGATEKKVIFSCDLGMGGELSKLLLEDGGPATSLSQVRAEFDLRKMVREGKPDL